jgi:hypothetical protein
MSVKLTFCVQAFPHRLTYRVIGIAVVIAVVLAVNGCDQKSEAPTTTSAEALEFEGSWNAAGTRRTIPLGPDRKGSTIDLRGTMLLSGAQRPAVGFRAEVIALVDTETGLVGRGVWTDERGDEVFSELKGEGTKEKNRIVGTIFGGTGRYAGATGSYEFSWQFVIESEEGSIQGRALDLKGRVRPSQDTVGGARQ